MRMLYKYPQAAYPYEDLVVTNRARSHTELEYELLDTGVFSGDRYFDVEVEYAKADPEDLIAVVTVTNRGPARGAARRAGQRLVPDTWTWVPTPGAERPVLADGGPGKISVSHPQLGQWVLWVDPGAERLFTENETNAARLFGGQNRTAYVKDGIDSYVVHGNTDAVNPARTGTPLPAPPATVPGRPGPPPSDRRRRDPVPGSCHHAASGAAGRGMLAMTGPRLAMIDAR